MDNYSRDVADRNWKMDYEMEEEEGHIQLKSGKITDT